MFILGFLNVKDIFHKWFRFYAMYNASRRFKTKTPSRKFDQEKNLIFFNILQNSTISWLNKKSKID